jgi:hypothetical protein
MSLAIGFIAYAKNRWPESKFWNPPKQYSTGWKSLGTMILILVVAVIILVCIAKYFPGLR